MNYISTRGAGDPVSSAQAILQGLAPDGGLYVPARFPVPSWRPRDLARLSYPELATEILALFLDDLSRAELRQAVERGCRRMGCPEAAHLEAAGSDWMLELFHGPTLAFKDVALSLLPELMALARRNLGRPGRTAILTATSGDTGSAAMAGFAGDSGSEVLVFFPARGISGIQRRQMTCMDAPNVHAIALDGNFDEAQSAVKRLFLDRALARSAAAAGLEFSSANSVNIARLLPQVVYHAWAWLRLDAAGVLPPDGSLPVAVPTGNFGNILAADYARRLGFPVGPFLCATNENRVLADFLESGRYDARRPFRVTNSPSMDILVSSNLERALHEACGRDSRSVAAWMADLRAQGRYQVDAATLANLRRQLVADSVDAAGTEAAVAELWNRFGKLYDPHTAVAWKVAQRKRPSAAGPVLVAATASPWKFPRTLCRALGLAVPDDDFEAMERLAAATGLTPPPALQRLRTAPESQDRTCGRDAVRDAVCRTFGLASHDADAAGSMPSPDKSNP